MSKKIDLQGLSLFWGEVQKRMVSKIIHVTYNELADLRNNGKLIPGQQYRITDYVTTTNMSDPNLETAGHSFDIIVTADTNFELNETAKATWNDNDAYFDDINLTEWELKYSFLNDTSRFGWADPDGKGVIYYMKDDKGNEVPYDFKNIKFFKNYNGGTYSYYYTFSFIDEYDECTSDASMMRSSETPNSDTDLKEVRYNIIKPLMSTNTDTELIVQNLNNIIFLIKNPSRICNNTFDFNCRNIKCYDGCYNNTFGNECMDIVVRTGCYNNAFGNDCTDITLGNGCYNNAFGNNCMYNDLGAGCYNNTVGNYCTRIDLGDSCSKNLIRDTCNTINFGATCNVNTIGSNCNNIKFNGNTCSFNTVGINCSSITFTGQYCSSNAIGDGCSEIFLSSNSISNTFGPRCSAISALTNFSNNIFGTNCRRIIFGNYCIRNSFGDNCQGIQFNKTNALDPADSGKLAYCINNTFDPNVTNLVLFSNNITTSPSKQVRNLHVFSRPNSGSNTDINTSNIFVNLSTDVGLHSTKIIELKFGEITTKTIPIS